MGVVEFLLAVVTALLFLWWILRTLFFAFRNGIMLMTREPFVAPRQSRPVVFWFMAFVYLLLLVLTLVILFLMLVVPFIH